MQSHGLLEFAIAKAGAINSNQNYTLMESLGRDDFTTANYDICNFARVTSYLNESQLEIRLRYWQNITGGKQN